MHNYLEPEDDGLPMLPFGPWAQAKLDYLRRYIDTFVISMHSKPWRGMHYIDLFAGPGKCYAPGSGEVYLGSPLIALQAAYPFTGYFFIDLQPKNIAALQERCSASPIAQRVQCWPGDSNVLVQEVVRRILTVDRQFISGQWPSLNLAFLDPAGLDLHWSTVASLAQLNRMDLIIHYPQMGLKRYMPHAFKADDQTKVDLFFGGTDWRKIYEKWQGKGGLHSRLINHYKEKLQQLGYREVLRGDETGYDPLVRSAKRRAPLYRLLFASKHPLGHEFWAKITSRDVYGQSRLL